MIWGYPMVPPWLRKPPNLPSHTHQSRSRYVQVKRTHILSHLAMKLSSSLMLMAFSSTWSWAIQASMRKKEQALGERGKWLWKMASLTESMNMYIIGYMYIYIYMYRYIYIYPGVQKTIKTIYIYIVVPETPLSQNSRSRNAQARPDKLPFWQYNLETCENLSIFYE